MTPRFPHDAESFPRRRALLQDWLWEREMAAWGAPVHDPAPPAVPEPSSEPGVALPSPVYVPDHYEDRYPYPLIVWVQSGLEPALDVRSMMPLVSDRNYLGYHFRLPPAPEAESRVFGDTNCAPELRLPPARVAAALQELEREVRDVRRLVHVHTERVYLAGFDHAATYALQFAEAHPDWFAGVAAFGGGVPWSHALNPATEGELRPHILLATGVHDRVFTVADQRKLARALTGSGLQVVTRLYDAGHQLTPAMLRDLNRWIMDGIHAAECV